MGAPEVGVRHRPQEGSARTGSSAWVFAWASCSRRPLAGSIRLRVRPREDRREASTLGESGSDEVPGEGFEASRRGCSRANLTGEPSAISRIPGVSLSVSLSRSAILAGLLERDVLTRPGESSAGQINAHRPPDTQCHERRRIVGGAESEGAVGGGGDHGIGLGGREHGGRIARTQSARGAGMAAGVCEFRSTRHSTNTQRRIQRALSVLSETRRGACRPRPTPTSEAGRSPTAGRGALGRREGRHGKHVHACC